MRLVCSYNQDNFLSTWATISDSESEVCSFRFSVNSELSRLQFVSCLKINNSSLRHCLFVAEGLHALFEAESYADGSVAAGRSYYVGQVKA
jgi:hypothetical protein